MMQFLVDIKIHSPQLAKPLLPAHLDYLNRCFESGDILLFAAYADCSGGMLIAKADSEAALEELLARDPLRKANCAAWQSQSMHVARASLEGLLK